MPFPNFDPVFLRLGPLEFRWYGLMYVIGFISAYFVILAETKAAASPHWKEDVADLIYSVALGVILGGRTGYVLSTTCRIPCPPSQNICRLGRRHVLSWRACWSNMGGAWYARKKGIGFLTVADIDSLTAPIGLGLGRLGNFINGELYGRVTTCRGESFFPIPVPAICPATHLNSMRRFWKGLCFSRSSGLRHEPGAQRDIFWAFLGIYGIFRFSVEFFREPDFQLGFIPGGLFDGAGAQFADGYHRLVDALEMLPTEKMN